ncbi:MAG: FAD-dependent oxidoreductase [Armatimonadetes bacterium]|nr:FAD-dependent oxidoreductase [Armatimonadota bacterium]
MDKTYDIAVIGGGLAGCAAGVAAAREGAKTLLVERFAYLGGWATAALVNPFMTHKTSDGKPLVAGLYNALLDRLARADGLLVNSFDSEVMIFELQEMVLASGADIRLHTYFEKAYFASDGAISLKLISKSGMEEVNCRRLIDCSGDGDAAASLGAEFQTGDENGLPQAVTLMFDMGGVDLTRAIEYVKNNPDQMRFPKLAADADPSTLAEDIFSAAGYYDIVRKARNEGNYTAPGDLIFYITRPRKGEVVFNTTHVGGIHGTNADDLTRAEIESRRQMMSVVKFVKEYVPGFDKSYLLRSAAHVGVRETRRIVGEYIFCARDVIEGKKYDDAICRLAYPVDVHSGKGEGYTKDEEWVSGPQLPPKGDWYEIPYRCLLPLGLPNVLVAGRCISSTQAGNGAVRIMPACIAMGEAAGTAAAISLKCGVTPADIDVSELIEKLRSYKAAL